MRALFAKQLHTEMGKNPHIFLLVGDLGYRMWDKIRDDFPERFINTGAAEQAMLDIGVGLALEGKIPVLYSITPFILFRAFETIRTYINYEKIPVKLIGAGRDFDYQHDGISHWAHDDLTILAPLKAIKTYRPVTDENVVDLFPEFLYNREPVYINLTRKV